MKYVYFLIALICPLLGYTQNLINNSSFEKYDTCPQFAKNFYVSDWWSPNFATPDYFNFCSIDLMYSLPINTIDSIPPTDGHSCIGIVAYSQNTLSFEHIQSKLSAPLIKNRCYKLSLWVYAPLHNIRCDKLKFLEAFFSHEKTFQYSFMNVDYKHMLYKKEYKAPVKFDLFPYSEHNGWFNVSAEFTANGGEKFITIGLFTHDTEMVSKAMEKNKLKKQQAALGKVFVIKDKKKDVPPSSGLTPYDIYYFLDKIELLPCQSANTLKP